MVRDSAPSVGWLVYSLGGRGTKELSKEFQWVGQLTSFPRVPWGSEDYLLPADLTLMLGGAGQKGISPTDIWGEEGAQVMAVLAKVHTLPHFISKMLNFKTASKH